MQHSWLHSLATPRSAGVKGDGLFATGAIVEGEIVTAFGGSMMVRDAFSALPPDQQIHSLQIADDLFLACPPEAEDADLFNHSCEPNLGISGSVMLVAMRDISPGEELTFDYAMCDADDYDEFECACGTGSCRRKVTGNDWLSPTIQDRYRGWFSTYLERRIDGLQSARSTDRL